MANLVVRMAKLLNLVVMMVKFSKSGCDDGKV